MNEIDFSRGPHQPMRMKSDAEPVGRKRILTPSRRATLQFLEWPSAWALVIDCYALPGRFKTEGEALAWAKARGYEVVR